MFNVNPVDALISAGIKKLKEHPEIKKALIVVDSICVGASKVLSRLSEADIQAGLSMLNGAVGNKFTTAEIVAAAAVIAKAPEALNKLDALVKQAEKAVG